VLFHKYTKVYSREKHSILSIPSCTQQHMHVFDAKWLFHVHPHEYTRVCVYPHGYAHALSLFIHIAHEHARQSNIFSHSCGARKYVLSTNMHQPHSLNSGWAPVFLCSYTWFSDTHIRFHTQYPLSPCLCIIVTRKSRTCTFFFYSLLLLHLIKSSNHKKNILCSNQIFVLQYTQQLEEANQIALPDEDDSDL
jgi:hypothetical protein